MYGNGAADVGNECVQTNRPNAQRVRTSRSIGGTAMERAVSISCPRCLVWGEFVYELRNGPYFSDYVMFVSLSRGFNFRSSGTKASVVIMCLKCNRKADLGQAL